MSLSDDIALQIQELYTGPKTPYDQFIQDFLNRNPLAAAQTYPSALGAPTVNWDSNDTAGIGKKFGIGFFVQDQATGALYRCLDATPGAAIWRLVLQEEI